MTSWPQPPERPPAPTRADTFIDAVDEEPRVATTPMALPAKAAPAARAEDIRPYAPTVASDPGSSSAAAAIEQPLSTTAAARYQTQSILGAGGMGEVWLSHDAHIGRDVALKRLRDEQAGSADARRRFLREARVQALMEHPAVVPVYDLNTAADGSAYFTMRRVRGRSLDEVLRALALGESVEQRQYSRRKLLTALVNVCLAVHYAHTHGVVHRDLKPSNIMLGEFGEVYLLDWGVAKLVQPSDGAIERASTAESLSATLVPEGLAKGLSGVLEAGLTLSGQAIGTIGYMAPEQMLGEDVDARADVYALGAILYEINTLRPLHEGNDIPKMYEQMRQDTALDPAALEGVAPELVAACRRATAFRSADRFGTSRELADAIERYLDGDRDLEARRKAAAELTEHARSAAERAYACDATPAESSDAHTEAMHAAMRALAFDPQHPSARQTLARLLVEVPEQLPQAAEAVKQQANDNARLLAVRFAIYGFLSWLVIVPFVFLLGVRDWLPVAVAAAAQLVGLGLSVYAFRRRRPGPLAMFGLAVLALTPVSLFSVWLGPFVLVPVGATVTTLIFASQATPRERPFVILLGVLAAALPLLVEWLGIVSPSYAFVDGHVVLFGRALELPPTGTNIAILYTSVMFCIGPTLFFGAMRDALSRAERRLYLQAWQLRRLSGDPSAAPLPDASA